MYTLMYKYTVANDDTSSSCIIVATSKDVSYRKDKINHYLTIPSGCLLLSFQFSGDLQDLEMSPRMNRVLNIHIRYEDPNDFPQDKSNVTVPIVFSGPMEYRDIIPICSVGVASSVFQLSSFDKDTQTVTWTYGPGAYERSWVIKCVYL